MQQVGGFVVVILVERVSIAVVVVGVDVVLREDGDVSWHGSVVVSVLTPVL